MVFSLYRLSIAIEIVSGFFVIKFQVSNTEHDKHSKVIYISSKWNQALMLFFQQASPVF